MKETYDYIHDKMSEFKHFAGNNQTRVTSGTSFSTADEILKYKNLLDMGAITKEEFNAKKKELLNL